MEIFESISWVVVGFRPTLCLLGTHDRIVRGRKKSAIEIEKVSAQIAG
jgi:hypothetical protein